DHPLIADDVQLAVLVTAEGYCLLGAHADQADFVEHAVSLREGEEPVLLIIAEDIDAVEAGIRFGAVDESTGDRLAVLSRIRENRLDIPFALPAIFVGEPLEPLVDVPSVVFAAAEDVDFLVQILPDVAGPEISRDGIEAEPPRLTKPVSPDRGK